MATTLTPDQLKRLVEILHPWFLGREQEAIIAALEKTITYLGSWYDSDIDNIYQILGLLQGPTGADMIGITDLGGYFSGTDVEAALQQLGASIAALPTIPTGNGFRRIIAGVEQPTASFPTKAEVGLGNVDNTSDANKPVSTAQAAANSAVQSAAASDATTKANNAQAYAIQRSNHTGTQAQSTVTNLVSDLAGKLGVSAKAADSELLDGIDSTRVVYGDNAAKSTGLGTTSMNTAQPSGFFEYQPSAANAPTTGWQGVVNYRHTNLGSQYGFQLSNPFGANDFYVRAVSAGSWLGWERLMTSVGGTFTGAVGVGGNPAFGAKLSVISPSATQASLLLWETGFGASHIGYLPSDTKVYLRNCYADGLLANGLGFSIDTAGVVAFDRSTYYGARLGQHINLYGTSFGQGIQNATHYFRAGAGSGFAWHVGGTHSDLQNNAGGGLLAAVLSTDGLFWTAKSINAGGRLQSGTADGTAGTWLLNTAGNQRWFSGLVNDDTAGLYNTTNSWCWQINVKGVMYIQNANSGTLTRQPRNFVSTTDPGAAAEAGDIWTKPV